MTIGARIAKLRKDSGVSQEYVAEQLGVSRQAVSKWEQDSTAPDTYNLIALAQLFDVSVEYIATGKTEQTPTEQPQPQPQIYYIKREKVPTKTIVGIIMLCASVLLPVIEFLLLYQITHVILCISIFLLVGGIICLAVKKHPVIVLLIVYSAMFLMATFILLMIKRQPFPETVETVESIAMKIMLFI